MTTPLRILVCPQEFKGSLTAFEAAAALAAGARAGEPDAEIIEMPLADGGPGTAAILAAALGLVIVFAAGFAPSQAVHNAAHDTRHTFAFPCH